MTKATIAEVAARAGVTKSTVSHALSGKRPVARETRARIEAAIAELGYRPNPVAQRLAAGRSRCLGLVFPAGEDALALDDMPFIASTSRAAGRAGYTLALVRPGESPLALADLLADGLLDAALLLRVALHDPRIDAARAGGAPFALLGRAADNAHLSFVDVDIDAAVDMAVEHLHGLGHRKIAYLGPLDAQDGAVVRARQAYELACARRRMRLLTAFAAGPVDAARRAARSLWRDHPDLTGVVAWREAAGWGVTLAAGDEGRRVPEDVSVVCLGQGVAADLLPFEPTRIDLRAAQLAEAAVALLLEQLDGDAASEQQILLQPELIAGQTTARAM